MGYELPVRVDFLDDIVESIRVFDPDTQISAEASSRSSTRCRPAKCRMTSNPSSSSASATAAVSRAIPHVR